MDDDLTVADAPDHYADIPETVRPSSKTPRWPWIVAGVLILIGVAIAVAWPLTLPFYTLSPGPVYDTSDFVEVEGGVVSDNGELLFLTVSRKEANVFEWAAGHLDDSVTVVPRENIRPPDVSPEQLRRESLALMQQSQQTAIYVALTKLDYEVTLIGTGAVVIDTVPGSGADGVLLPNDIIIEMNGKAIAFRTDVVEGLSDAEIGDLVEMIVERPDVDDPEVFESLGLEVVLGPHTDDPGRPMIGVLLDNNEPIVEFPVEVSIESSAIGGPSAGMMFTLQIMDQLMPEDLTKGYRIAGTGTINTDGTVGAIGGVHQKVYGAIESGAHAVLVPARNYDDAVAAAQGVIEVIRVETIDDALAYLDSL